MSSIDQQADLSGSFVSSDQDPLPKFDILVIHPSPEQITQALQAWRWLDLRNKTAVLVSSFGDIFFEAQDGIYLLSVDDGNLQKFAHNRGEFRRRLSFTGPDEFLFASLVSDARTAGMQLAPGECYEFIQPPQQGGKIEIANLRKANFVQKLNELGRQRYRVVSSPPPQPRPLPPILIVPILLFLLPLLLLGILGLAIPSVAFAILLGVHAIGIGAGYFPYLLTRAIVTRLLNRAAPPRNARWLVTGFGIVAWVSTTIGVWFLFVMTVSARS